MQRCEHSDREGQWGETYVLLNDFGCDMRGGTRKNQVDDAEVHAEYIAGTRLKTQRNPSQEQQSREEDGAAALRKVSCRRKILFTTVTERGPEGEAARGEHRKQT